MPERILALCLIAAVSLAGCYSAGRGQPQTVQAEGVVTLDGQPVEGATVTFSPVGETRAAVGKTDAQGKFRLAISSSLQGAMPGEYHVSIAKERTEGVMTPEEAQAYFERTGQPPPSPTVIDELPAQYKNPATSGLKATVDAGGSTNLAFALTKQS